MINLRFFHDYVIFFFHRRKSHNGMMENRFIMLLVTFEIPRETPPVIISLEIPTALCDNHILHLRRNYTTLKKSLCNSPVNNQILRQKLLGIIVEIDDRGVGIKRIHQNT